MGGIGSETATALSHGAPEHLILVSRDEAKVQPVIDKIREHNASVLLTFVKCDLASQKSVRQAAKEILPLVSHIDVLINNAATPPGSYSQTEDGIEAQFGTNHIGHFLLTNLLMPKILDAGAGSRIVVVSSSAHRYATQFLDYNFSEGNTYSAWDGYTRSKACNVLFAKGLSRMLESRGIQAFSLHPGSIASGMQSQVTKEAMAQAAKARENSSSNQGGGQAKSRRKNLQQGCATTLVAALDPRLETASGSYLDDGCISRAELSELVTKAENADSLWSLSEKLVGQHFDWS